MRNYFKNHPFIVSIIIALILAVIIIFSIQGGLTAGEDAAGSIFTPIASITTRAAAAISNWWNDAFEGGDVKEENEQLKERVLQLEGELVLLNNLEQENERLKGIANYVEQNSQYDVVTATVSAKNPGYWFDTFVLNAGRKDGIAVDMPVITSAGLVGRVQEVGANWCKVIAIIDARCSVSSMIERTRDVGAVRGIVQTTEQAFCSMHFLSNDNDLVPGDRVLTSGLGGIYPKGLVIGEVSQVSLTNDNAERTATIKPSVDFANLEEVMIIKQVFEKVEP